MSGTYQVRTSFYEPGKGTLLQGDCLEVMRTLEENSIDALVCDPPAGVSFMNKKFDSNRGGRDQWIAWLAERLAEAYRLMKPGAHGLIWALPRTAHWTCLAIEEAGFEIRTKVYHHFGVGFPKSHAIDKAIDKLAGAERKIIAIERVKDIRRNVEADRERGWNTGEGKYGPGAPSISMDYARTAPETEDAQAWSGWGTSLKPATEEWILVRKPISENTIAENVLKWGCGAINIDACRIPTADSWQRDTKSDMRGGNYASGNGKTIYRPAASNDLGRWPADLILSHSIFCAAEECHESCPIAAINAQGPGSKGHLYELKPGGAKFKGNTYNRGLTYINQNEQIIGYGDEGGSARYFKCLEADPFPFLYAGKASRAERNAGLEALPIGETHRYSAGLGEGHHPEAPVAEQNTHPTVKSQQLMKHFCRMVGVPGGKILDCFAGSGSTLVACIEEGFQFVGIEMEDEYIRISHARLLHALKN